MNPGEAWKITEVFDNGGRTADRYCIHYEYGDGFDHGYLFVGEEGNWPNGICYWSEDGPGRDSVEIDFADLPEPVQRAALAEEGVPR